MIGDWDGVDEGRFYLDLDGGQTLNAADLPSGVFGTATDKPISGRW